MYSVRAGSFWEIQDVAGTTVLEVTAEDYAQFLCDKLNQGDSIDSIHSRVCPDIEFFEQKLKTYQKQD